MKAGKLGCWLLVGAFIAALACPATAAPDPVYTGKYAEAQRLYEQGRFAEAIPVFQAAYELRPKPGILFNIGQCHLKLGHARTALGFYERYQNEAQKIEASDAALLRACVQRALDLLDEQGRPEPAPELAGKDPPAPALEVAGAEDRGPALRPPTARVEGLLAERRAGRPRFSARRKALAWTLGGLMVASLAAAITLTALEGQPAGERIVDGQRFPATHDNAALFGAGYAAAGLLGGGLALTLALPERGR